MSYRLNFGKQRLNIYKSLKYEFLKQKEEKNKFYF